jgi:hypothetical protein
MLIAQPALSRPAVVFIGFQAEADREGV